jgi:alpha-1,6-mannosyltransferase
VSKRLIFLAGLLLLIPYALAWRLGDLRQHTVGFLVLFFLAFALYGAAVWLALRVRELSTREIAALFALAVAMQSFLIFTPPTLSDDMYRYVWNGRVQAQGISPYQYPPNAPEVAHLRDAAIYPHINRKSAVTVYPPAAETAFALLWRVWPDNVRGFQIAMAGGGLLAGVLLLGVLRELGQSPARLLVYLWSPLLAFETAHAAHVDGLILPLLVGAWWARLRRQDGFVGILLGLATAVKLYPVMLLPALWRPRDGRGRWSMPLAFAATLAVCYTPYVLRSGPAVIGYLPDYLHERFNMGLAGLLLPVFTALGFDPSRGVLLLTLLVLGLIALVHVWRPPADDATAVRRCLWPIGAFTLLTQNLFPWYMLWLLPLIALFLAHQPQSAGKMAALRVPVNAWTGWWLFCGLIALSYSFFIQWRPVAWAVALQFIPLYLFLLADLIRHSRQRRQAQTESPIKRTYRPVLSRIIPRSRT